MMIIFSLSDRSKLPNFVYEGGVKPKRKRPRSSTQTKSSTSATPITDATVTSPINQADEGNGMVKSTDVNGDSVQPETPPPAKARRTDTVSPHTTRPTPTEETVQTVSPSES